jgi:hypothetical protein
MIYYLYTGNQDTATSVSGVTDSLMGVENPADNRSAQQQGQTDERIEAQQSEVIRAESGTTSKSTLETGNTPSAAGNRIVRAEQATPLLPVKGAKNQQVQPRVSEAIEADRKIGDDRIPNVQEQQVVTEQAPVPESTNVIDTRNQEPQLLAADQKNLVDAADSAAEVHEELSVAVDSLAETGTKEKAEQLKLSGIWRLSFSFLPQYLTKSITPVATDEVLVTGAGRSDSPDRLGWGFAVGGGKAVSPNLYIDAQLSWMQINQDIAFSYATGVDTLLTVQQPDQTYLVSPVYRVQSREITSRYTYGGLRLGGTYYFWTNRKRRFNLAASAGVHYLLSARVREKVNGEWVILNNDNLNTINYSLMAGAGYNLNLNRGWELLINPTYTYFLREVKNNELPYDLNQRSVGLNIMLSRTLGR